MIPQIHRSNLAQNTSKKSENKFRIAAVEDVDDRSESWESDNSHFSQTFLIQQQDEPELPQFSWLSSLNSEESSSATAIDHSIKNQKKVIRVKAKIWQCWCSILVSWYFHHFLTS
jgi:hypothetical protein